VKILGFSTSTTSSSSSKAIDMGVLELEEMVEDNEAPENQ
jgi:hypothetical protein